MNPAAAVLDDVEVASRVHGCGDAPEFFVRGVGSVEQIGASIIKVGYITFSASMPRARLVLATMWDLAELMAAYKGFPDMLTMAMKEGPLPPKVPMLRVDVH